MNLLTEDNHLFSQQFDRGGLNDDYKRFVKISRWHSTGLILYSLMTMCIFLELVILLIVHKAKGGIGGKIDVLYVQERW